MSNSPNAPKTTAKKRSKAKSTAKKTAKPKAGKVANPDSRDLRSPDSRDSFDRDVLSYVSKNGEVQSRAILDAIGGTMTQIRASLGRLIDKNLVDAHGDTRARRYFIPGAGRQEDATAANA